MARPNTTVSSAQPTNTGSTIFAIALNALLLHTWLIPLNVNVRPANSVVSIATLPISAATVWAGIIFTVGGAICVIAQVISRPYKNCLLSLIAL